MLQYDVKLKHVHDVKQISSTRINWYYYYVVSVEHSLDDNV